MMFCEKTGKRIIKGVVDPSRSTDTHFATKTALGYATYSRQFYISEYEVLLYGSMIYSK